MPEPEVKKTPRNPPGPPINLAQLDPNIPGLCFKWEPPVYDGGLAILRYKIWFKLSTDLSYAYGGETANATILTHKIEKNIVPG
jgi:hypothetical protein